MDKYTIFIKFLECKYRQKFGIILKNNKNLNPFENSNEYKFLDFAWIEIILHRFDVALIKILFSSNFGLQMSAKICDYLKKIIKI